MARTMITLGDFDRYMIGARITGVVECESRPRTGFSIEKDGADFFVWPGLDGYLEVEAADEIEEGA